LFDFFVPDAKMFPFKPQRRALLTTAAAMAMLTLAGCDSKAKKLAVKGGSDITGTHLGSDLSMVDQDGHPRTLADYKGKIVVVFFGYTHCPDVCPTAMAQLAQTMALLKGEASQTQVLMITIDPQRDTPQIMGRYVKAFNPNFVGLTGTPKQVAETAKSFKAYYAKEPGPTKDSYVMNHSSSFYILDKTGDARILLPGNALAEVIAHDIQLLV
jgi:protein SCO1/2